MNKATSILILIVAGIFNWGHAQLTTSNLPIVILNTSGATIPDEPKIDATMGIIDNGPGMTNNINDPFNHYNGNIGIETRGNSTQGFDKKTYSIELRTAANQDTSVALLGMGKEEDWILHAMVIDKTQLRIPMSFYLSQRMGHYAAHWKFVEVVLNGDYRGLYILTEKIKRDDDRVDIAKLDADDLAGDSVTGGYILRIDWLDNPQGFESNFNAQGGVPMFYQWYYPKAANILPQQAAYIEGYMDQFEEAVFASNYTNNGGTRYTDYINLNSFTDFLLINELSKNSDGYKLSSYLHKDKDSKGGKLTAGPIWDFDQTYGMSTVCSCDDHTGWTYLQNQPECEDIETMPMWWQAMMQDTLFTNYMKCRWDGFRNNIFHEDTIHNWIDAEVATITDAINRNFTRWSDFIGEEIWAEPFPVPQTYAEEITYFKNWIDSRLAWMDANLPGNCNNNVLSVNESEKPRVKLFPNPARTEFFVEGAQGSELSIITLEGKLLYQNRVPSNVYTVDISNYDSGIYLVQLVGNTGLEVKKLMVE